MNPNELRIAFEARGLELGVPADERLLYRVETQLGLSFDTDFRKFYFEFNGFISHDGKSHIFLWPLERIVENANLSVTLDGGRSLAIGDFLMDSDFLMANIHDGSSPVFLLFEKRVLAPTISALLHGLASGQFDL